MPTASGSLAFLGAARFQGYWDATTNSATGSGLPGQKLNGVVNGLFSTGSSSNAGGYANATGLTASIGDYWQVTGSGTHNVDGSTSWVLNDWCVYSGSAGSSGNWSRLSFDDTIASIVLGDLSASSFHIGSTANDKHVIFATGSVHSGSSNFTFDYTNNLLAVAGNITASTNISASAFYGDGSNLENVGGGAISSVTNGANDRIATFSAASTLNGEANLTFSSANLLTVAGNITASTNISASAFYGDGANLTNLPISTVANGADNRLATFSSADALNGEANLTFDGSTNLLTVGGNITGSQFYGGNIYNKDDPDTFIDFETANNQINFMAGGFFVATALGTGAKNFKVNTLLDDVDFIVHGDNTANLIYANAGLDRVGIVTSSPEHILSVTGTLGVSGDTTISGSSYLKNAIVTPGASGGTGITVTHTDVDQNGITINATNTTTGGSLLINHDDDTTAAADRKTSFAIDFDKTGVQAQSTTASFVASEIIMVDSANNHAGGTVHMTGSTIFVTSSHVGGLNTTNTGLRVITQGADTNYDALFLGGNVGIGDSAPLTKLSVVANSPNNTALFVRNDGNDANRNGIFISCGKDAPGTNGDIIWLLLADGDSDGSSGVISRIRYDTGGAGAVLESASDKRIKTDIKPSEVNALEILNNIPLSEFRMAKKNNPVGELNRVGFVAQDCEEAWPEMVSEMEDSDYAHKIKTVAPATLIPVLVKAVQELSAEIEALKNK